MTGVRTGVIAAAVAATVTVAVAVAIAGCSAARPGSTSAASVAAQQRSGGQQSGGQQSGGQQSSGQQSGGQQNGGQQPPVPSPPAPVLTAAELAHPDGKFFGVEADGSPDSLGPAQNVAASVGKNPNLLGQYVEWGSPFDQTAAARSAAYGALYYMSWEPFGTTLASIADGGSDGYVRAFAKAVAGFGAPVALSFGHEMNGNWYPWGTTAATPAQFVAAWRHLHDVFASVGATNVIWVWNPNIVNGMPDVQLAPLWPGRGYVNWVGVTGYFGTTGPYTFDAVYGATIAEVEKFTTAPIIIAETAVQSGPGEVESIRALLGAVRADPNVIGFIWFNYEKLGVDWTLGDRPTARAAVASGVAALHLVSLSG